MQFQFILPGRRCFWRPNNKLDRRFSFKAESDGIDGFLKVVTALPSKLEHRINAGIKQAGATLIGAS